MPRSFQVSRVTGLSSLFLQRNDSESESTEGDGEAIARDGISPLVLSGYAVGHCANDLCASLWFLYLGYYLIEVVGLTKNVTGLCLLSGQIADGIATPLIGYLSDKFDCKLGKRNTWYFVGSILVVPAFLCIFVGFDFFSSQKGENIWYIVWSTIFAIAWSFVQINHLTIANELSYS